MSTLLDTNAWIFFLQGDKKFGEETKQLIIDSPGKCYISIASIWEAAIKTGMGKLHLPYSLKRDALSLFEENGFQLLPIDPQDALTVENLPQIHRDPFDRIQTVQCQRRNWQIISADPVFDAYGLMRIW